MLQNTWWLDRLGLVFGSFLVLPWKLLIYQAAELYKLWNLLIYFFEQRFPLQVNKPLPRSKNLIETNVINNDKATYM